MTKTTDIAPALTPDEWRTRTYDRGRLRASLHDAGDSVGVVVEDGGDFCGIYDTAELHVVAAFANAALPDDDPRKIRREDVEWVEEVIRDHDNSPIACTLAAKLAALLPPA